MFATRLNPTKPPAGHRAVLERVGAACRELRPFVDTSDALGRPNDSAVAILAKRGVFGVGIDAAHGGSGADPLLVVMAAERIGREGLGMCRLFACHAGLGASVISHWGTDTHKQRYLIKAARGECIVGFASVGEQTDENRQASMVRCETQPNAYQIDGSFAQQHNGRWAHAMLVLVRTHDGVNTNCSLFVVERDTPGVDWIPSGTAPDAFSDDGCVWRLSQCVLTTENLVVGAGNAEPNSIQAGDALAAVDAGRRLSRLLLAAGSVGTLADCLELTANRVADQPDLRESTAWLGLIAEHIARSAADLEAARALAYAAAELRAEFDRHPTSEHLCLESGTLIDESYYFAQFAVEQMRRRAAAIRVGGISLYDALPPRHRWDFRDPEPLGNAREIESSIARYYLFQ